MHGVKDVFVAVNSAVLPYTCTTWHTLATFVPSLHLLCVSWSWTPAATPRARKAGTSKRINHLAPRTAAKLICEPAPLASQCKDPSTAHLILGHRVVSVRN